MCSPREYGDAPLVQRLCDKLDEPAALEALFREAGVGVPAIVVERWRMPLATPEHFWPVVMGTSNRGVFDALAPAAQERVRRTVTERLRDERVTGLDMEALIAVAHKG